MDRQHSLVRSNWIWIEWGNSWARRARLSSKRHETSRRYDSHFTLALLAAGTFLRLQLAARTFLNPDEALHYFIAASPTFSRTYTASLTTAHPPLMFLSLHWWIKLGSSEFILRLPYVLSGLLFAYLMFRWVDRVAGRNAALMSLALCLLSPSLVTLSAEVRQYSPMLLFCAASLYYLERGFQEDSWLFGLLSVGALWLALLTHYSALIFAAAVGLYGLVCLWQGQFSGGVKRVWLFGQVAALAICGVLFKTQISRLHQSGLPSEIAATWLRGSIFHPAEDHLLSFAVNKTVRLFRYFVSHGTIGVLALFLFLFAAILLFARHDNNVPTNTSRPLALLLVAPFVITLATAIAGLYPYGGTRHDVVLIIFAIPGIAVGLDRIRFIDFRLGWIKILLLVALLVICNVFPAPSGPFIRPRNQTKQLMTQAIVFLQSQPSYSIVVTDYQGGLVLGYYLCGKTTVLPFGPTPRALVQQRCANYEMLTLTGSQGGFERQQLSGVMEQAWKTVPSTTSTLSLFQTGWIEDEQAKWLADLHQVGCRQVRQFGPNIRICECARSSSRE